MCDAPVGVIRTPVMLGSIVVVPKKSLLSYKNRYKKFLLLLSTYSCSCLGD